MIGLTFLGMVLLWLGGDEVRTALRYERVPVLNGEWWRLVTGHWVHGDFQHLVLNLCGVALVIALFQRMYTVRDWVWVLAASTGAIDIGFLAFEPQLTWYVGASGVLHGALAAGAVAWWRRESKFLAVTLSIIFVGKLALEQTSGALPLASGMSVIVDAHLYGAIGGALTAAAIELIHRRRTMPQGPL